MFFTARIGRCHISSDPSQLARYFIRGWGLNDLPLRASDEHILIVRVPRAQKIIRLHPRSPVDSLSAALLDSEIQF